MKATALARYALRLLLTLAVWAFIVGTMAGRWDWARGWVFVGWTVCAQVASTFVIWRFRPDLLERRTRMGPGTVRWDRALVVAYQLATYGIAIVGAGTAGRHGEDLPLALWPLGAALYTAGIAWATWALAVNRHFEPTVRLQTDQGHTVVDAGPYRFVRHPGYLGGMVGLPGLALMLGSTHALIPATIAVLLLFVRTAAEDRFLHRNLEGYAAYAARVRSRLLPGMW
ncbi:MAG: isoprenylcysteine carboxylmethyltransferase family protein [Pseudomonadota bacterium]